MDMGGQATKKGLYWVQMGYMWWTNGEIYWDYRECKLDWIVRTIKAW